jgi:hypothetical protein
MSGYQCYEFVALERPLTATQMAELRTVSTRADITPTRFWNEYHWGDFKGDSAKLVARYFDAHLYFANWGTRRLMLRIPSGLVAIKSLRPYFISDAARASSTGKHVIVDLCSDEEGSDYAEADDGLLTALAPLRAELMCGDFRVAYLAWLLALQAGEVDEDATEPPLPPDLSNLTAAQQAMVDFLRIDRDLLTAAAAASPAPTNDSAAARRWVHAPAPSAKSSWLERAIREPGLPLGTELLRAFRQENKSPPRRPGRRVAELLATAEELRAKRARAARRPSRSSAATAKPQEH